MVEIEPLLDLIAAKNPHADVEKIRQAYAFAENAHKHLVRKSGEPYIVHPLRVAHILVEHDFADTTLLCAAFLHDVVEDTNYTVEQVSQAFGEDVGIIVSGLTKFTEKETGFENFKAENLRKIILATAKDARVMLIKLADRLHNMETLHIFRLEKQHRIANETLNVYAPMAEKIGLYQFKSALEDLSFKSLEPAMYEFVREKIHASEEERSHNTQDIITQITQILSHHKVNAVVNGRAKHFYSIYKKMKEQNKTIDQIYDLYGIRIIVDHPDDCYKVYRLLQGTWKEMADRFKDFIKTPKPNGYQSLHANFFMKEKIIEVQIRTKQMDYQSESGVAIHWKYKGTERDKLFDKKINWLKQILLWRKRTPDKSLVGDIDVDIFKNEIIVITPKGDPVVLTEGSTAVDFAYTVHSSIGDHIKNAKVNSKIVPLETVLHSGDIVNIETSPKQTVSASWLTFVRQPATVSKIRRALKLELEPVNSKKEHQKQLHHKDLSNLYNTLRQFKTLSKKTTVKVSKCCNPQLEDPIVAFYTKGKKMITVHKFDCPHQYSLDPHNKVVINWAPSDLVLSNTVNVLLDETPGALVEVLNEVLSHKLRISKVTSKEARQCLLLSITILKRDKQVIEQLILRIKKIPGVTDARLFVS